jgi:hypothetical protein
MDFDFIELPLFFEFRDLLLIPVGRRRESRTRDGRMRADNRRSLIQDDGLFNDGREGKPEATCWAPETVSPKIDTLTGKAASLKKSGLAIPEKNEKFVLPDFNRLAARCQMFS